MTDSVGNAAVIALVAIVPLVVLMLTSFVKVSVVLSLLRNAIGATDAPSGLVVMGVSLILTFFVMAPVAVQMVTAAASAPSPTPTPTPTPAPTPMAPDDVAPAPQGGAPPKNEIVDAVKSIVPADRRDDVDALARALEPLKVFLARHAAERDKETFVDIGAKLGQVRSKDELAVLAPAFVTTELREAFAIAVLIFVPFLVIDLLVGLGLAALGLQTTSPQTVALPIKLLLFVAVDGWRLLIDSLLRGYA